MRSRFGRIPAVVAPIFVIAVAGVALRPGRGGVPADELARLIDRADALVVLRLPGEGSAVLFRSSERRDLDALKSALKVGRSDPDLHCMCDGTPAIVLYAGGEKIGQVTNQHARLIRCSLWEGDAPLVNVEAFLKWFDDRKVADPRQEYEAALKLERESREAERKWVDAMPPPLKAHWPAVTRSFQADLAPLRRSLAEQVGRKDDRILALFSWYGSGAGPWSGFPSYEAIAETMLLDYSTRELLEAIEGKALTEAQTEGVARLFGGWTFSQFRPGELRLLPAGLKGRLLKHSLASGDEDKRGRARRAFGGE